MVDFFGRQDQARLNTLRLLPYFVVAVFLTAVATYLLCIAMYAVSLPLFDWCRHIAGWIVGKDGQVRFLQQFWIPNLFWSTLGSTVVIVVTGSLFKFLQLRKGGAFVALELGGRRVSPQTRDPDERRLMNVVEEMAIASSTPVPDVYILARENSVNAFAAGHCSSDTVIGVTHGCLNVLDRDELQGVIAHEYSHILNGDMRLNMRLAGIVHGIVCITLAAWRLMMIGHEREIEDKPLIELYLDFVRGVIGFLLAFIGWNGAFMARMIKSAVCREREFLADAAAVQFTRFPDGLAGALRKAKAWASQRILLPAAEDLSHIFFNNVRDDDQHELTSTHPPVAERVKRLNPGFLQTIAPPPETHVEAREAARPDRHTLTLEEIVSQLVPKNEHVTFASKLLSALPGDIAEAAHDMCGACALIYALLVSSQSQVREVQLKKLEPMVDRSAYDRLVALLPVVDRLELQTKLPLVEISFPALRRLPKEDQNKFLKAVHDLVHSDKQIDLFEFALQKMLRRHLQPAKASTLRFTRIKPLGPACSILLSTLAHAGHDTEEETKKAFRQGGMALGLPADDLELLKLADCSFERIENALDEVAAASNDIKNLVLNACLHAAASDGTMRIKEVELLRAIADALGCAIPPIIQSPKAAQHSVAA